MHLWRLFFDRLVHSRGFVLLAIIVSTFHHVKHRLLGYSWLGESSSEGRECNCVSSQFHEIQQTPHTHVCGSTGLSPPDKSKHYLLGLLLPKYLRQSIHISRVCLALCNASVGRRLESSWVPTYLAMSRKLMAMPNRYVCPPPVLPVSYPFLAQAIGTHIRGTWILGTLYVACSICS